MLTLWTNGTIFTMNPAQPRAEAVLVKDGRLEAVGALSDLRAQCGAEKPREIDLAHNTLLPAFVDGHSHIALTAQSMLFAPLGEAKTLSGIQQSLRSFMEENNVQPGEWVVGTGYDPQRLVEKRHPTREVLDVFTENPVLVSTDSGHMGCMNTAALRLAGVTADTAEPQGGRIGREASGEPNGYLEEAAFTSFAQVVPPITMERMLQGIDKVQRLYASYGVATAQEGLLQPANYGLLKLADEKGALRLDVVGYADIRLHDKLPYHQPNWGLSGKHFRVGGYKMFLDGSPQGRTAWLTQPYLPAGEQGADYRGYPMMTLDEAKGYVRLAASEGRQLLTHCNGDAAIDQLMDAHERPSATRNVIIHAQTMRIDQLPRVKALGLMPSYFVAHVMRYGDQHIRNLGMERASHISPVASTAKLGIPYTLHQDTPVMHPNMAETVAIAMRRVTEAGVSLDGDERVTLEEALRGVTRYGAYQCFEEDSKGMLKPGMRADMTVLSGDWATMSAEEIETSRALSTYKDGEALPM